MNNKYPPHNKVALLATGDEIKNGDILNTNSQETARRLFSHGIVLGTHMVVGDQTQDIETAISYLLQTHQALIITGGLGPTSDDLTRYALANYLKKELIFDATTWNTIVQRLKNFGYKTPPDTNKQQALFPEGAMIIPNPNGTAAACMVEINKQWIFMLPGPPAECLPILDGVVIPTLLQHDFKHEFYLKKWLLFGVSEGEIAETLDAISKPYACTTGYRICYPYIEFKIYSDHEKDFLDLTSKINEAVKNYIIEDGQFTASDKLKQLLSKLAVKIFISDTATGGLLETTILTPETFEKIIFVKDSSRAGHDYYIELKGLTEFWQRIESKMTSIDVIIQDKKITREIPLRGIRVKQYAVELACRIVYKYLTNTSTL